jgi:Ca2+-transporting ATPase
LGDRCNLAFAGTQVALGRGVGVVVATGMATELGRIAGLLQAVVAHRTPLQRRLDRVGKQLAVAGVAVALAVVVIGRAGGESLGEATLTAISVAVAVIPEGLPAVVTFTLAIGAQRMLRRNALIRKLPAVETLGSVTVICSDKTGTLTQNLMTATVLEVPGERIDLFGTDGPATTPAARAMLAAAALCNDAEIAPPASTTIDPTDGDATGEPAVLGDPTETALLVAAQRIGLDVATLRRDHPRIGELPFDSDRKLMTTLHPAPPADSALGAVAGDGPLAVVKGAPDRLLALATAVLHDGRIVPADDEWADRLRRNNDELARAGMRVLAVGCRTLGSADDLPDAERDLVVLGLVGIIDPPRAEVGDAVATCRTAGVRTVMITGDHPLTADAIARQLGIRHPEAGDDDGGVLTGRDLDQLDDDGLDGVVERVSVYARVSPEHKLRIVAALRRQGHVVAMTGDGVNDAPALKQADIGVAMGITGTDVSKEASDMVLRDDNFATIVASVEEGRVIYDNLRRFVRFAVAGNIGKMLVMIGWPLAFLLTTGDIGVAAALVPLQLLWLNLMTDGILGLSMGLEPAEKRVMSRPPHQPDSSIWSGGLGWQAAWVGTVIGAVSLGLGFAYHRADLPQWQTMIVTSLTAMQVFQALGSRSDTEPVWRLGWRSNPLVPVAVATVVGLQLIATYTPLRTFLDLEPLRAVDLALCAAAGVGLLILMEAAKLARRT